MKRFFDGLVKTSKLKRTQITSNKVHTLFYLAINSYFSVILIKWRTNKYSNVEYLLIIVMNRSKLFNLRVFFLQNLWNIPNK